MGSLFANKTKSTSSGTQQSNTQSNYFNDPALQGFLQGYNSQYSGPNISSVQAPVNQTQLGAVANQSTLPGGLMPAFDTAGNIAQNGFAPQMAAFQNPFENQVVGNMQTDFARQNAEAENAIRGRSAQQGALGNNTGQSALLMRGAQDAQANAIANTRMTGFNTAANLANQNAQAQLAGAGQIGNLTGVNTGANTAQFGMGETMRNANMQNQMTPFQLWNQGLAGQGLAGQLSGQNTTGSNTGTQTSTQTPGLMQSLMGIAGLGMSGFNWGQNNGWWGNNGSMPYTGGGMPKRDGGSVKGFNDGGSVIPPFNANGAAESFADKVARAHETVSKLRASGGRTESRAGQFANRGIEPLERMNTRMEPFDPWRATVRHTTDAEQNDQDPFWSPAQAERMVSWPPFRPMQYEIAGLRGYDEGGSVLPEVMTPFPGFNASNTTPMGPTFGGNPFAQFMPGGMTPPPAAESDVAGATLGPETTGQILPFGGNASTSANIMEAYNPNGPPRSGTMVPTSGPGPVMDPNATTSDGGAGRRRMRPVSPNEEFAAMLLAASGPQVFGGAGEAALKNHQRRVSELNAAQQLAHQNAGMQHNRDQLAETVRHNQATEANRAQNRPETAYQTTRAQAAAKAADAREAQITTSQNQLGRIDQMERLLDNQNMPVGRFANWELEGRRVANAIFPGVGMEGVREAEAFRALSNGMALSIRSTANGEGMPGAMSDADLRFLTQSVPQLETTREGNRLMLRIMRDTERYKVAVNAEAARYIDTNHTNQGLGDHMVAWMKANPMAKVVPGHAENRTAAETRWNPTTQPPGGTQQPAAGADLPVLTPEQARQLPPGTRFRGTDGNEYKVPGTAPAVATPMAPVDPMGSVIGAP